MKILSTLLLVAALSLATGAAFAQGGNGQGSAGASRGGAAGGSGNISGGYRGGARVGVGTHGSNRPSTAGIGNSRVNSAISGQGRGRGHGRGR